MTEREFLFYCFLPAILLAALWLLIAVTLSGRAIIAWAANLRRERVPAPLVEPVRLRGLSASAESSAAAPAGWIQP